MGNEMNELRYLDLKNALCEKIYEGIYKDGKKIPSERQLSTDYEVSRITVRKTLELMEKENLIVREVGNGTRVTLKNYGNANPLDVVALTAPSRNPFFANFIAEFQKQAWEKNTLLLYVEVPERATLEDCLYRLYTRNIRNVVVWQDDQTVDREKLLRLRSIGMNMVFFDADDALPYADAVFLDNVDAVKSLLKSVEFPGENYLYVGWDNRSISNVRKREAAFTENCPDGGVVRIPWRRDRKIEEESVKRVKEEIQKMPQGMIVCGAGDLTAHAAEELGLVVNTKVVCGGGDGPCSALGAGSTENGQMFLSYGTSAWIAGTSDEVFLDKDRTLICFGHVIPGKYMPCGTMQAAGSSYSYIRHAMCGEEEVTAEKEGVSIYDVMNRLVEQSPAGAKGLIFLPYLVGERSPRWNPDASGSFLGIRMEHEKCDYIRAVLEGVAMNLGIILEKQRENGEIQDLVLTGGGAKGDTLSQILADVLGVRLHRLDQVETATSVAAAVIAGIGVGVFKDFSVVDQFVKREKTFVPREEYKPVYDHQKKLFEKGYECLLDYYKMSAEE